jgi:hypothetical protein
MAFDVHYQDETPTDEEYRFLEERTSEYYNKHLTKIFGDDFKGVEVSIRKSLYGAEKPNKHYNVYVEWDIFGYFHEGKEPRQYDLMVSLVRDMDVIDYLKYIRESEEMCWSRACSILNQQTIDGK